jgi:tetratricopeptide (TPR) repeat protein
MQIALKIARTNKTRRQIAAWFVTGSDPAAWISQLTRWNLPLTSLILRPIPTSFDNRQPLGVLVTTNLAGIAKVANETALALPFGCIGGRLYLPVDASVVPIVTDAELIGLLPADNSDFIWHPAVGLVRCEISERLTVLDLVRRPTSISSHWDRAVPGIAIRNRLLSIEPTDVPTADDIMRTAGEDIGTQQNSIGELPPAPGEGLAGQLHQWTTPLRQAWKSFWKRPPAKPADSKAGSQNPTGNSAGSNWLARLGSAAAAPFAAMGGLAAKMIPKSLVDQTKRLREIDRLLHLLNDDPDAGLKFALPMGSQAAARGSAQSGNQLVGRDISFGLGKLFASGPVDPWDIPPGQQLLLIQRYRELATREIRMGRHRRAAYIFAELLGDLQGAANTLELGQHYREAAILYRERLKRPLDAARCLERGGLLDEAAKLYIEQGMMENAADLYYRLERPDEAERLLRNWAAQLAHEGHHIRASTVFHEKLKDVDEALVTLDSGWAYQAPDAESCLKQTFQLLGQYARHDNARERIQDLREATLATRVATSAARAIANVATNYVDRTVQRDAEEAAQVIVARHLKDATEERVALLNALRSLAPQDRLLGRDCDRFVRQKEAATPKQPVRRIIGISHLQKIELGSPGIEWRAAKSDGEVLYAAGYFSGGLLLRRVSWQTTWFSNYQDIFWAHVSNDHRVLLEIPQGKPAPILIHAVGHDPLGMKPFIGQNTAANVEQAGSPVWATNSMAAFACSEQGINWRLRVTFGIIELAAFGPTGDEINNGMLRVSLSEQAIHEVPISICVDTRPMRIGVGRLLCPLLRSPTGHGQPMLADIAEQTLQLDAEIESLYLHKNSQTVCVIALFAAGGVMIPEPVQRNGPRPFAHGIESPKGVFLADGTFVVAGRKECRVYRFDNKSVDQIGEIALVSPTVAVTRAHHLGQFAILSEDGSVNLYSINQ